MPDPLEHVHILGICWYLEQDYPAVLQIMADAHTLPDTFQRWQQIVQETERRYRAKGKVIIRVVIDPTTFPEWCRSRDLNIDARARNTFAEAQAYRQGRN